MLLIKMSIIGITGKKGSGKTTIANILSKNGYNIYNMADPLKDIAKIFGFTNKQLYGSQKDKNIPHSLWNVSSRRFMQQVGTELFRQQLHVVLPEIKMEYTVWSEIFRQKYLKNPKNYVVGDVRFLDEARLIKDLGGIIIRVNRNGCDTDAHISETEMNNIIADITINNDTNLENLENTITEILYK